MVVGSVTGLLVVVVVTVVVELMDDADVPITVEPLDHVDVEDDDFRVDFFVLISRELVSLSSVQ